MKKSLLLIIIFNLFIKNSFSQDWRELDNLRREIIHSKVDSIKIKAALELSYFYQDVKIDSSIYYASICQGFLKEAPNTKFEINLLLHFSKLSSSLGRDDRTLEYLLKALNLATNSKLNDKIAAISNDIANFYQQKSFEKVIEYYKLALNAAKKTKDKHLINEIMNSGSNYYFNVRDYNTSKQIMDEQIKLNPSLRVEMFEDYGDLFRVKGDYKSAKEYYLKAIKIFEDRRDTFRLIFLYHNFAMIPLIQEDYNDAIHYLNISKKLANSLKVFDYAAKTKSELAEIYAKKEDYPSALKLNLEAIEFYKARGEVKSLKDLIKFNSEIHYNLGNTKEAYKELNTFLEMDKAQNSKEIQSKISLLESSILLDKKQNEINLLNKDKEIQKRDLEKQKARVVFFIIGLILLLVFTIFIMRSLKIRNKQNKIIAEQKAQSDALLLNILPAEVAEELKIKGSAEAKQFDEVTVLFTDFKGFTQISEKMTPNELVDELNTFFKAFNEIVTRLNIEKIKTIGDSYMCVGGLPKPSSSHAENVVNAGLEIHAFVQNHSKKRIAQGKEPLLIRIGIHSGPVIAGIVGIKKFAYDIWGDTVNTASRMESSGEAGQVNISGTTYELVKEKFIFTHRGKIQAKGKGELDMYFVEGRI